MKNKKAAKRVVVGLFLVTAVLSFIPALQTLDKGGFRGVPPKYIADDLYYYGRMKEVVDGYPMLGNPYFIEYRDAVAPAFFIPDWLAAAPLFLGVPISLTIVLNFVFWSLVFVFLAYRVGRFSGMASIFSAGLDLVAYVEVYWVIFRPVAMQQIFPLFLIFLLVFFLWLRSPLRRQSIWMLAIASAVAFYMYMYLWQIILCTLSLVLVHMLVQKKWPEAKSLLRVALYTGILALPALAYMVYQIRVPLYWETARRIGLVSTHLPTFDAYLYGRWAILLVVLYLCSRAWVEKQTIAPGNYDSVALAAIYSGLGLALMTVSDLFTGQDIATAAHIGRFITLWVALFFPIFIWKMYASRAQVQELRWPKLLFLGVLTFACLGFLGVNLKRSLPFQKIAQTDIATTQEYAEIFKWLELQEDQAVVVWANEEISRYIPIMTKHYVLWANPGILHFMSDADSEDRFFASQFRSLARGEMLEAYRIFGGVGSLSRHSDAFYKNRLLCMLGGSCNPDQNFSDWIGAQKVDALVARQEDMRQDFGSVIKRYQIRYLVLDKEREEEKNFTSPPGAMKVWENDRFIIYRWDR